MIKNEYVAALRLQKIPFIGDITAKKLISHCGSPAAVFNDKRNFLQKIEGVGEFILNGLNNKKYLDSALREYEFIQKQGITCLLFTDEDYPEFLRHCPDGPFLLFSQGNIDLSNRKIISIVGTRNMTSYGRGFCQKFIEDIAPLNPVIISGFALGVDICAQKAAMESGLQTIGCLAHGMNQFYPRAHARYVSKINENGGFFTEFWSTSQPERENFIKRNRIIAGISQATIVIESAEKGGSLVTADFAVGYNRDVFAVPGRAGDHYSRGCNNLIKQQKAQLITSAADLVYLLNWDLEIEDQNPVQKKLFVELEETENTIYQYLLNGGKQQLDTIALSCHLPVFKASSMLLGMEMKGVIRSLPGKLFEAV